MDFVSYKRYIILKAIADSVRATSYRELSRKKKEETRREEERDAKKQEHSVNTLVRNLQF